MDLTWLLLFTFVCQAIGQETTKCPRRKRPRKPQPDWEPRHVVWHAHGCGMALLGWKCPYKECQRDLPMADLVTSVAVHACWASSSGAGAVTRWWPRWSLAPSILSLSFSIAHQWGPMVHKELAKSCRCALSTWWDSSKWWAFSKSFSFTQLSSEVSSEASLGRAAHCRRLTWSILQNSPSILFWSGRPGSSQPACLLLFFDAV